MIKRIPVSALRVGMYITDLNNDWIPHNTQRRRGVIKKEETIEWIRIPLEMKGWQFNFEKGLSQRLQINDKSIAARKSFNEAYPLHNDDFVVEIVDPTPKVIH